MEMKMKSGKQRERERDRECSSPPEPLPDLPKYMNILDAWQKLNEGKDFGEFKRSIARKRWLLLHPGRDASEFDRLAEKDVTEDCSRAFTETQSWKRAMFAHKIESDRYAREKQEHRDMYPEWWAIQDALRQKRLTNMPFGDYDCQCECDCEDSECECECECEEQTRQGVIF